MKKLNILDSSTLKNSFIFCDGTITDDSFSNDDFREREFKFTGEQLSLLGIKLLIYLFREIENAEFFT